MGWSCRLEAGRVMDAWRDACVASTGMSNVWEEKGARRMFEPSRREHRDGAITGEIRSLVQTGPDSFRSSYLGSFRINPDGTIARGPAILKQAAREALARAEETARKERAEIAAHEEAQRFFDDHISFVVVS